MKQLAVALCLLALHFPGALLAEENAVDPFEGLGVSASAIVPMSVQVLSASSMSSGEGQTGLESASSSSPSAWTGAQEIVLGPDNSVLASPETASPESLTPGRLLVGDLPEQKQRMLVESFLHDRVLQLPPQTREVFATRELREAWEGNVAKISTGFENILMRFRKQHTEEVAPSFDKDPEYFDIRVSFRDRLLLVQHTEGRTRRSKVGVEVPFPNAAQERFFIEGRGRSGMTVLFPRIQKGGQYVRSMLLCPRYAFKVARGARQPDDTFFVESPYRLVRTMYGARASVEGGALSGGGVGLAHAEVLTTPNMPRSKSWEDSSYGVDPSISLTYLPFTSEQLADVDKDGSVVAAIEGKLVLHKPAGFKRESVQRSILWFKEFTLSSEQPWFIRIRGERPPARVAPGPCYSLLLERLAEQRYTREDLSLPERLRSNE